MPQVKYTSLVKRRGRGNMLMFGYLLFPFSEWDTFERKCLTILKQCTSEDLNKMKRWLQGDLPDSKLQKVEKPSELFSLMVEAELLSPDNLHYLGTVLSFAGRQDLRQQLKGELKILLEQLCTQQYWSYAKPTHKIHIKYTFFSVNILNNWPL